MLARNAFKAAELVPVARRVTQLPIKRVRPLSDDAASPSQKTQSVSPKTFKKNRSGVRREQRTPDPSHPTRQVASLKPPVFTDDVITSPSPGSPNYIPNKLRSFQSSVARRDAPAVLRLWRSLEKNNLLHVLGPSDLEACSRMVVNLCPAEPGSTWSGPCRGAVEELALGVANRLSTSALRACFTSLVIINDSEGVLWLYDRFLSQMEHQNEFEDDDDMISDEGMQDELSTMPTIRVFDHHYLDRELTMFAIMAHATRDDFSSAIQFGIHNKWNLPSFHTANGFLDTFAPTPKFREKVLTFLRHLDAARFISRPHIFHKHLSNLIGASATLSLRALYSTMVEGLSETYPWAIVDSEPPADNRPVSISESIWASFISAFLEVQRLDWAESAWDDMIKYGHKPGSGVWAVLIKGVGKLRGPGTALALWRSMKETPVSPDSSSYQAIVQVMVNARQWKEAAALFDEFRSIPSLPSDPHRRPLFNTMISAHLANSSEPDAIRLLEEMLGSGPNPSAPTFNIFLTYYHNNKDMKSLSSTLKRMTAHGVSGDVATFSILLCTLLRIVDRGEAIKQTLAIMDEHKIKPNVATYTAIMTSLLQEKDKTALEAALDLLRAMEESGDPAISPNVVTYTAILNGLHSWVGLDDRLVQDCTELIVRKMKMRRVKFNKVTYNVLLKTCLENPSPAGVQKALQFYRRMRGARVPMTGDTWHIMLHGLARRSEWDVAHEVLRDMQGSGIRMTDWLENACWGRVMTLRDLVRERMACPSRGGRSAHMPSNSNAFRATCPRRAEVRRREFGPAALNFPPTLVGQDDTLRRLSHPMKSRSRRRRQSLP
ncbi:hypothetical protein BC827DRAFT_1166149 [Russula dissimulans]|nr:hypothetical protein BC827DRAFT_1166149 [Russula dissimulans]